MHVTVLVIGLGELWLQGLRRELWRLAVPVLIVVLIVVLLVVLIVVPIVVLIVVPIVVLIVVLIVVPIVMFSMLLLHMCFGLLHRSMVLGLMRMGDAVRECVDRLAKSRQERRRNDDRSDQRAKAHNRKSRGSRQIAPCGERTALAYRQLGMALRIF